MNFSVLVTGRDSDVEFVHSVLDELKETDGDFAVKTISGESIGDIVGAWSSWAGVAHETVDEETDLTGSIVVGFVGDDRTGRTIRRALSAKDVVKRFAKISPLTLIQEELRSDPWKMLCACMLLNKTNHKQVRPILRSMFSKFPRPEIMAEAPTRDLAEIIRTCGLQNRRAAAMIDMSYDYIGWRDAGMVGSPVAMLHGIGEYASDSWRIFQLMDVMIEPDDKELKKYVAWAKTLIK